MTPVPDKKNLRTLVRQRRSTFVRTLPEAGRALAFRALPSPLARRVDQHQVIALYMPMGDEAPTGHLAMALRERGKTLCLPRVIDQVRGMVFHRWDEGDTLVKAQYGQLEPTANAPLATPDMIIAPLVAYDRNMNRLGQGGSYYDRAFARLPDARRIGLAWSVQELDTVPCDPWDLPLHAVVTECEYIEGTEIP